MGDGILIMKWYCIPCYPFETGVELESFIGWAHVDSRKKASVLLL